MKKWLMTFLFTAFAAMCLAAELAGTVRDEAGKGIAGIRVSDGFKVVQTASNGSFKIAVRPKSRQIFVIVPKDRDTENFYLPIKPETAAYDFVLKSRPARTDFSFVQYSDHECNGLKYTDFLNDVRDRALAANAAFVVSTGDLCGEKGIIQQCSDMQRANFGGIKTFLVCGNHDLRGPKGQGEYFYEDHCGPSRYAFEEGNVLFIVLPMIRGDNQPSYTANDLADFTKSLLDTYPIDQQLFILAHYSIPGYDCTGVLFPTASKAKQIPLADRRFLGLAHGHTHWNCVRRSGPAPIWCTGQSRAGGAGNSPGSIRVMHFTADGKVTSELFESNVNHRVMFCGDAANGLATISAFSSGAAVSGIEAVINGKKVEFQPHGWLWTANFTPVPGKAVRYRAVVNFADGKSKTLAGVCKNDSIKKTFQLQKMLILPGAQFFGKPVVAEGRVYTTIFDEANGLQGGACAVNLADGKILWHTVTGNSVRNSAVLHDGKLYFTDSAGDVQVLDAKTGRQLPGFPHVSKPISPDHVYFGECLIDGDKLITGLDNDFRAIDLKTGKVLWSTLNYDPFGTVNPYVIHKNRIYSACNWNYPKCFDADTGKLIWDATPADKRGAKKKAAQPNLTILDDKALLYNHGFGPPEILELATGKTLKASKTIDRCSRTVSLPLIYKNRFYVGTHLQSLVCIDLNNLEMLWNAGKIAKSTFLATAQYAEPLKTMESSPVLINGQIAAVTGDGVLRLLDADTGKQLDAFIIGAPVLTAPVYQNGLLYITDYIGRLFVFDMKSAGDK